MLPLCIIPSIWLSSMHFLMITHQYCASTLFPMPPSRKWMFRWYRPGIFWNLTSPNIYILWLKWYYHISSYSERVNHMLKILLLLVMVSITFTAVTPFDKSIVDRVFKENQFALFLLTTTNSTSDQAKQVFY